MRLPRLSQMMMSYFHQDYDLMGENDKAILRDFAATNWQNDVEATIDELDSLLTTPAEGLLERFERGVGGPDFIIGDDDAAAREWLKAARRTLADAVSTSPRQQRG